MGDIVMTEKEEIDCAKKFANEGKCQGVCDEHVGDVKTYKVAQWGYFAYCECAKKDDIARGLILAEVK